MIEFLPIMYFSAVIEPSPQDELIHILGHGVRARQLKTLTRPVASTVKFDTIVNTAYYHDSHF